MRTFRFQYILFQNDICISFSLPEVFKTLFKIQISSHYSFPVAKNYRLLQSWKFSKSGSKENLEVKLILLRKK